MIIHFSQLDTPVNAVRSPTAPAGARTVPARPVSNYLPTGLTQSAQGIWGVVRLPALPHMIFTARSQRALFELFSVARCIWCRVHV